MNIADIELKVGRVASSLVHHVMHLMERGMYSQETQAEYAAVLDNVKFVQIIVPLVPIRANFAANNRCKACEDLTDGSVIECTVKRSQQEKRLDFYCTFCGVLQK